MFPIHSRCFLFFILLLISITCWTPFSYSSHESEFQFEMQVLLKLKQQWLTSPSVQTWNTFVPPCNNWSGILCSNNSITGISLSDENINATIPTVICDLPNLTFLNLSHNSIPDGFPTVLYNCSKLKTLDLLSNKFRGLLPTDIYKLSNLEYLDIGVNYFTGDIPSSIGRLTKLTYLSLENNLFNGTFANEIGNLINLETLSMGNNSFVPRVIPMEFGKLKNLKYLHMWGTNLIGHIPPNFANFSSLRELDLSVNNLVGDIPSGLFLLKNLSWLHLFDNQFSGEIPTTIEALNLVDISLYSNNLMGVIPKSLGKLQKLERLYLYNNQLSGSLPICLANLSSLVHLDLSYNNLTGTMPKDIGNIKKLEFLYLQNNQLCGSIPGNFVNLSSLNELDVANNNLKGSIPKYLGKLRNLKKLHLEYNQLSGPIPQSLTNCTRLQVLCLDHNNLIGQVPLKLWILPNMQCFDLKSNKLSGNLPSKLSAALHYLDISNNIFSGPVQPYVSKWKNLNFFLASNNRFQGTIPSEITALQKLNILQLDGNLLSGSLPSNIISWNSLTSLDFSRNNLLGSLPVTLGSLRNLKFLNLSHNKLSSQIPSNLGFIIDTLDLSSNNLSGKIPSIFENVAYNTSFLSNPKLCSTNKILNVPTCSSSRHKYVLLITIMGGLIFILILCVTLLFKTFRHGKDNQSGEQLTWEMNAFHKLEFTEIEIVSSLTEDNVIGSGGSGKVYLIELNDVCDKLAVKKIMNNRKSKDSLEKQFLAEVEILGRIRHANIVKLWCCISSQESKHLVYEYMENESLDNWLHGNPESTMLLDWPTRLRIAAGAAKGLSYMHHDCSPPIIHRDVKSSNILLDTNFNAKVADFGLAKISTNRIGEPYTASAIAGTIGYIAPEYSCTRRLNEKIDVYSFGVVLLELATGKEPRRGNEYMNLADWSQQQYYDEECPIEDVLDDRIKEPRYLEEMINVFKLGVMCTCPIPSSRPSMRQVSELLICFKHEEVSNATLTEDSDEDVGTSFSMESHILGQFEKDSITMNI